MLSRLFSATALIAAVTAVPAVEYLSDIDETAIDADEALVVSHLRFGAALVPRIKDVETVENFEADPNGNNPNATGPGGEYGRAKSYPSYGFSLTYVAGSVSDIGLLWGAGVTNNYYSYQINYIDRAATDHLGLQTYMVRGYLGFGKRFLVRGIFEVLPYLGAGGCYMEHQVRDANAAARNSVRASSGFALEGGVQVGPTWYFSNGMSAGISMTADRGVAISKIRRNGTDGSVSERAKVDWQGIGGQLNFGLSF